MSTLFEVWASNIYTICHMQFASCLEKITFVRKVETEWSHAFVGLVWLLKLTVCAMRFAVFCLFCSTTKQSTFQMPDLGQWTYKVHKSEGEELWSVSVAYNIGFQSKPSNLLRCYPLFFYWVEVTYFFFYFFIFNFRKMQVYFINLNHFGIQFSNKTGALLPKHPYLKMKNNSSIKAWAK